MFFHGAGPGPNYSFQLPCIVNHEVGSPSAVAVNWAIGHRPRGVRGVQGGQDSPGLAVSLGCPGVAGAPWLMVTGKLKRVVGAGPGPVEEHPC